MKDNFSTQSELYAKYRPQYPGALFDHIASFVKEKKLAWDCGTGNGQVALELSKYFKEVHATDISEKQIQNAVQRTTYSTRLKPQKRLLSRTKVLIS